MARGELADEKNQGHGGEPGSAGNGIFGPGPDEQIFYKTNQQLTITWYFGYNNLSSHLIISVENIIN
jgi:hypothetical protein